MGWRGNRKLTMPPVKGMKQQIVDLNRAPAIKDLHAHQLRKRLGQ